MHLPEGWILKTLDTGEPALVTTLGKDFLLNLETNKKLLPHQPLAKACHIRKYSKILDITAGWGVDSYLLAQSGCSVTAIENNKIVFSFLKSWQTRSQTSLDLNFILDDSLNYLKNIKNKPDVIYMDPMFTKGQKGASSKSLRILQELTKHTKTDPQKLLDEALKSSCYRVVVKRHRKAASLKGPLQNSILGRAITFDIFKAL